MRNPNGYGSVFKLSGKNRRRPYVAKLTVGWTPEGKQQFDTIGYYETRPDAMIALAEYWKGGVKQGKNLTLANVYDEWSRVKFDTISASTKNQYVMAWKHMNKIHSARFADLRTSHFQGVIQDSQGDLKRGSLEKIKILAGLLYQYALQNDLVLKNYAQFITLPREDKLEKEVFTDLEIQKLWMNSSLPYVDTILILIYTGMRVGEMLKLTQFDIDLTSQTITGGLKTDAGKNRIIPIHPKIMPMIEVRLKASGLPFPYSYTAYSTAFKSVMSTLEIENKTPHSTRHTFATLMARGGADTKALQKIIGHANYSTTADIYTHLDTEDLKRAMNSI